MEDWNGLELMGTPLIELGDVAQMIFRIFFNTFMVWLLIHTL